MSQKLQSAILSLSDEHGGSLTVVVDNNRQTIRSENPMFGQAVEAYRNNDWDSVLRYMSPEKVVKQYLFQYGDIKIENGNVTFSGSDVHSLCVDRILQFAESGFDPMPLMRFLSKLQKNPSRRSVEELYRFLERNQLTVTTNGNFLAYKAVSSNMYSKTSGNAKLLQGKDDGHGRIFNGVDETIEVYRNNVDDDANNGCSFGLHAGTLEYAQGFASGNDVLVIVEIDPQDVVSVPHDCGCQKLRTCRYKVVDICTQRLDLPLYDSKFQSDDEVDYLYDEDYCDDCGGTECVCQDSDEQFLSQMVDVNDVIGWLFKNDYDDLAHSLIHKFGGQKLVKWVDIAEVDSNVDFLRDIAEDLA